ncbi:MAG: class I SAM-dependent methyltransferase [Deltaproteobacteria bacterium]|jgi:2-polyprenyl-3-methyl-5-hydroxy-6-metoxy-1,4-benzoquinol methylase|nr:class I SAM-dependent methyltransferase [Deltaproteobacteria bacterium]
MDKKQLNAKLQAEGYAKFKPITKLDIPNIASEVEYNLLSSILISNDIKPNNILEIGFNEGLMLEKIHNLFPNACINGTEVREDKVNKLLEKGFEVFSVDDEVIPGDETYDLIYGVSVLHHFSDPYSFIKHAYDRLNHGGMLIFINESHRYHIPCLIYSTLRNIWHLEKHFLKITKNKLYITLSELSSNFKVWHDDFFVYHLFPKLNKIFRFFYLHKIYLLNDIHLFIIKQ